MIILEALSRPQQALFILLKASIRNKVLDESFFQGFSEAEWKEVYRLAVEQGVMAMVFNSVMGLPDELKPPRSLKLSWAISVEVVEKRYYKQKAVAHDLADFLKKNNINMFLFKGLYFAQYYPIPSHREFGDLDIFLLGEFEKGNNVLLQQGLKKNHSDPKHTSFTYKGVMVENHTNFLTLHRYSHLGNLEKKLLELCNESLSGNFQGNILFPSTDFAVLYMMCHTILHFPSSFILRNLCDWVVFLEANKGKVDFKKYNKALAEAGLSEISDAITALAVRFFELNQDSAPVYNYNHTLEDKILQEMLNPEVIRKKNPSVWDIIKYKFKLLKSRRWKYELVNPNGYGRFLLYSFFYYLLHPWLILQFKR